jgi:hypothetical protein
VQVRELIEILLALPQEDTVYVNMTHELNVDLPLRGVVNPRRNNTTCVVLQDHLTTREAKVVKGYDGSVYEVPWK